MVLSPFTFMIDFIMNLMSRTYHKRERKKHHSLHSSST